MTTRSLLEIFILMRNNAMQSRHILSEQDMDDRMALVSSHRDPEQGIALTVNSRLPPDWVDGIEEVQYEIKKIKQKMKDLSVLHDKHLNRPTLNDTVQEHAIETITQEITQMFSSCQLIVQQTAARTKQRVSRPEQRVTKNVVSSLISSLQDLSIQFRKSQSNYLKKLKSREERSQHYFDTNISTSSNTLLSEEDLYTDDMFDRGFSDQQIQLVNDNTAQIQQREREVIHIVKSITELNEIFKDLGKIVVEQGTAVDRIDYNIEQSSLKVNEGLKQLQKADNYQKKNRKMLCIIVMALTTIILIIILIAIKS